jgi:hypothetical protein
MLRHSTMDYTQVLISSKLWNVTVNMFEYRITLFLSFWKYKTGVNVLFITIKSMNCIYPNTPLSNREHARTEIDIIV